MLGFKKIYMEIGSLRDELFRGALGSIMLKLISVLLGMVLSILLARTLGASGYGLYAYVFSIVMLISIPAQLGLPNLLVRETAKAQVNSEWGVMRGLWRWATLTVSVTSVLLVSVALMISTLFSDQFSSIQLATFTLGVLMVPIFALGSMRDAALCGLRRVVMGQLPQTVLRPGILILLLLVATLYISPSSLLPIYAMGLHVVAAALSFAVGAFMLWKVRPVELVAKPQPEYATRAWFVAAWPLTLASGILLINQNTDIIMLGFFRDVDDVGIYKTAVIGSSLVIFGLQAITMAISPHFSRLYSQGDMIQLQRVVTFSARVILIFSLPVVLLFVFYGDVILHYVFGEEYITGSKPLAILSGGQLINALMGSVGVLLVMTGHEKDMARGVTISAVTNVVLNLFLIPLYGMNGAALATALSLALMNLVLWKFVHRRLGIESMAFRFFLVKGQQ